ncbi:MAG: transcription antitermination factor NusB [Bacteroidota bacterium]|nr:transcription antitermination factor NusB [Bacteroidota bacterium]
MISRRLLRVKVLKTIYSSLIAGQNDIGKIENELFFSINKVYELYIYLFQYITEIRDYAAVKIEEARSKRLPVYEDLNPNMKFINNKVIKQIAENAQLKKYAEIKKINWSNDADFIHSKYQDFKDSGVYKKYMSNPSNSYSNDKKFVYDFFELIMLNPDDYEQLLEDKSIYWIDDLDFAVSHIIKTLRAFEANSGPDTPILSLYKEGTEEIDFAKKLLRTAIIKSDEYDELIKDKLLNWELERVSLTDNIIIKMAVAELLEFPIIPVKVTLNEYIEIAKMYSTPKSKIFINGVLDKIVMDLKRQNRLDKIEAMENSEAESETDSDL